MTRDERRMYWRLGLALFYAFLVLWLVGTLYLLWFPATPLDKACLGKPLAELRQCMRDFKK